MGIAYAKGLGIGLNIPVVPVNAFELYMFEAPDAFVAIDSGRGDFFVASKMHAPCTMNIDEVETEQMKCPMTVGHKPFDLKNAVTIVENKIKSGDLQPAIPMYLRPSYAEK
jgi:tRNA A37 threonylcarbamoyladenosine modification protein TsaB